jgi:hypothetical protein
MLLEKKTTAYKAPYNNKAATPNTTPNNAIPYPSPVPRETFCMPRNPVIIEINDKGRNNKQGHPIVTASIPVTKDIIASV